MSRDVSAIQPLFLLGSGQSPADSASVLEMFLSFFGRYRVISTTIEQHLQAYGLNEAKCTILMLLLKSPDGMSPSALAEQLRVTRGTVSSLIETLKYAGLIERTHNRFDRRKVTVSLSPQGREYISNFLATIPALRETIFAQLEDQAKTKPASEQAKKRSRINQEKPTGKTPKTKDS